MLNKVVVISMFVLFIGAIQACGSSNTSGSNPGDQGQSSSAENLIDRESLIGNWVRTYDTETLESKDYSDKSISFFDGSFFLFDCQFGRYNVSPLMQGSSAELMGNQFVLEQESESGVEQYVHSLALNHDQLTIDISRASNEDVLTSEVYTRADENDVTNQHCHSGLLETELKVYDVESISRSSGANLTFSYQYRSLVEKPKYLFVEVIGIKESGEAVGNFNFPELDKVLVEADDIMTTSDPIFRFFTLNLSSDVLISQNISKVEFRLMFNSADGLLQDENAERNFVSLPVIE